jgi:DNA-binding PadR family transcriptional regulator
MEGSTPGETRSGDFPANPLLALDALRLLTLVQQLGDPSGDDAGESESGERVLVGEERLIGFDHLLRHPATLAYVLIDHCRRLPDLAEKRAALARRIRLLLGDRADQAPIFRRARSRPAVGEGRPSLFQPTPSWHRCDDALAYLTSRGLLAIGIEGSQPPRLSYRLTTRGADLLEQRFYPSAKSAGAYLQACAALREYWPVGLDASIEAVLERTDEGLDQLRQDEQMPLEKDLLPVLFERTFRERL